MINEEKLMIELYDLKNNIENRIIFLETNLFLGDKDLELSKSIAKLSIMKKVINIVATNFGHDVEVKQS